MARTRRVTSLKRRSRKARKNKSHKKHGGSFWNRNADPVYGPRNSRLATVKNSLTDSMKWLKNSAKSGFSKLAQSNKDFQRYGFIGAIKHQVDEKKKALEEAHRKKFFTNFANRSLRRSRRSRRSRRRH